MAARDPDPVAESESLQQHQELLWGLKFTVEGLLAAQSTNVWSTYGGLQRLCNQLVKVMRHRLKNAKAAEGDYWDFVVGLRQLQPVLAPSIDRLHRQATEQGVDAGGLWLRTSLEAHTLASQLRLLVDDKDHLGRFYHADAFLCSDSHFKALYVCLQSVEQNNASILADLDPMLLKCGMKSKEARPRLSRAPADQRQPPLPLRKISSEELNPPPASLASPKSESLLSTCDEHARPDLRASGRHGSETAKTMLLSLLDGTATTLPGGALGADDSLQTVSDPLMNTQVPGGATASPPRRKVLRRAQTMGDIPGCVPAKREPRMVFEYGSSPQTDKLTGSPLGSSPLGSLHEEEDAMEEPCQCGPANIPPDGSAADQSSRTLCSACTRRKLSETDQAGRLPAGSSGNLGSPHPPPPQAGAHIVRASRQLRISQSGPSMMESSTKKTKKTKFQSHARSKSDHGVQPPLSHGICMVEGIQSSVGTMSNSLPADSHLVSPRKNSLLDSGVVSPATECYFPQPLQGQSLMSFLSSRDFERIPELDRENAHFSISEAIIAAVEQIRCKQQEASVSDHESDASDEEIQHLKQRIRLRRSEKRRDRLRGRPHPIVTLGAEARSDSGLNTLTSSASTLASSSANSSLPESETETQEDSSESSDSIEDLDLADPKQSNLRTLNGMGLSASLASLYSDADLGRMTSPAQPPGNAVIINNNVLSAESVALCLLRKFPAKHLPAASELQWLVSEQDAPQALLPMPKSLPVSPDDGENADIYIKKNTRLRGNADWAPPRAQIIFNVHPPPKRKVVVAKQNYRCAGCGMRIERDFVRRLRYCEYLGKYFCHCCHGNGTAIIPARVLHRWDFQRAPVCNFARELLDKMHGDPLFNVQDLNPSLYKKAKPLSVCKELRMQLFFLKDFLKTCRLSQSLQATYESQPRHLLNEPNVYSLGDLCRVRSGEMEVELLQLVEDAVAHVSQCLLCQAKGFICEVCNNEQDIIFPFQLQKTFQCQGCWACYHKSCFQTVNSCPKCVRKTARKISASSTPKGSFFSDEEGGD